MKLPVQNGEEMDNLLALLAEEAHYNNLVSFLIDSVVLSIFD